MSNISKYNYRTLDIPYNDNLERSELLDIDGSKDPNGSSEISSASQLGDGVISGSSLSDVWIKTWIKSQNYQPKKNGFLIDGQRGYIECMQLYVGSGGIVGGKMDIPDLTSDDSWHVNAFGDMWSGCNVADFEADNDNADAYILKNGVAKFQSATIVNGVINGTTIIGGTIKTSDDTYPKVVMDSTGITIHGENMFIKDELGTEVGSIGYDDVLGKAVFKAVPTQYLLLQGGTSLFLDSEYGEIWCLKDIRPYSTQNLGNFAQGWNRLYLGSDGKYMYNNAGTLYWDGTAIGGGGGGISWSTPVNANIIPDTDAIRNIGSGTNRFADAHIGRIYSQIFETSSMSTLSMNVKYKITFDDFLYGPSIGYGTFGGGLNKIEVRGNLFIYFGTIDMGVGATGSRTFGQYPDPNAPGKYYLRSV